jgi:predicted solute-binding protein
MASYNLNSQFLKDIFHQHNHKLGYPLDLWYRYMKYIRFHLHMFHIRRYNQYIKQLRHLIHHLGIHICVQ